MLPLNASLLKNAVVKLARKSVRHENLGHKRTYGGRSARTHTHTHVRDERREIHFNAIINTKLGAFENL